MSAKAANKPGKMLKIVRTDSLVRYRHEFKTENGVGEGDITEHDAPLKKFDDALQALSAVAAKVLECPPDWADGITVTSLAISYTKAGTRSATIGFKKSLDSTSTMHGMDTPAFQIDDAGDKEEGRRQCTPTHAKACIAMIERAEEYAAGDRQQMQLPLPSTKAEKIKKDGGTLAMFPEGREPGGKDE